MKLSVFLLAWFLISIPAGIIIGKFIKAGQGRRVK
jgi:hypothetical protein